MVEGWDNPEKSADDVIAEINSAIRALWENYREIPRPSLHDQILAQIAQERIRNCPKVRRNKKSAS